MSESKQTWNKWAKAAQKLQTRLKKNAQKAGLGSVDKPTPAERRAAADKEPAPTKQADGVYR